MNIFEIIATAVTTNMTGTIVLRLDNSNDIFVVAIENNGKKVFKCSPDKKQYNTRGVQINGYSYSTSGVRKRENLPELGLRDCNHTVAEKIFTVVFQIETIPQKLLKISDLAKEENQTPDSNESAAQNETEMDELEKFISLTFKNKEANRLLEMVQEFCELPDPHTIETILAFNTECEKINSNSETIRRLDSEIEDIEYKINGLYISRQKLIDVKNLIDELVTSSSEKKIAFENVISSYVKKKVAQKDAKKDVLEKLRKRVRELEDELGEHHHTVKEVAINEAFSWSAVQKHIADFVQNRVTKLNIELLKTTANHIKSNNISRCDLDKIMGRNYTCKLMRILFALDLLKHKTHSNKSILANDERYINDEMKASEISRRLIVRDAYERLYNK